jgi:hypothetical protein
MRGRSGLLSRPSLQQVRDYRQQVDMQVQSRLAAGDLDEQALHHLQLGCSTNNSTRNCC